MKKLLNILWQKWKKIALAIGRVQTATILSLIYFLIITPMGILAQIISLISKPRTKTLVRGKHRPSSYWLKRRKDSRKLADFYKQY